MFPTALYEFQMSFTVLEGKNGAQKKSSYFAEIEKFAVFGGSKRTIRKNGENGIGDADIMAEFYQSKQFLNLIVTMPLTLDSVAFQRIYDQQLSFDFTLQVKSLEPESRFRFIQLNAEKARITKPPSIDAEGDTLNIKYSNPQVFYWYANAAKVVFEKI
jgi:predicted nucleotidyltransferase